LSGNDNIHNEAHYVVSSRESAVTSSHVQGRIKTRCCGDNFTDGFAIALPEIVVLRYKKICCALGRSIQCSGNFTIYL